MSINRYIVRSTFVGALGGLLFGFDTAVISGTTAGLTHAYSLSHNQLGITVAIALVGTVIGAATAGSLGQRYGSREMLRLTAILYVLSAIGCAFAPSWVFLLAARFLGGLGIGGSSVLGPVYIAELAPPKLRGRLVGTFQINIVVGILLAYLSNYLISLLNLGAREWRFQLGIASVPAAIFFALLFGIPRSARWLTTQDRLDEAREVLEMMGSPNSEAELADIRESLHMELNQKQASLFESTGNRLRYGKPIFLAIAIGAFNQLSGINAILYYLNDIFAAAGFSRVSGNMQAVAIGAMNLVATLVGMTLIDRVGRKMLLLIGAIGTAICLSIVAVIFATNQHKVMLVWALVAYIAFFAISQGAVVWVYISEIFPTRVRGKGQSLGSGTHWVLNAALSWIFPVIAARSGAYPFIFFAAMMVLQFIVVLVFFPETKQVSLEELQRKLKIA
ncbi:sugar porter family MFS transporter [Granulicella mallensis]|uniref:Sugar transporter n=1 Tax=Granulicella mallensis (strain ATCC BAA-1857 / DSM 23137 / MP5ACTX8) TaxID=682795 RepID=G8P1W2_GRAMM|nr:sugar porter family MFS transporter [Granulicella mallensis]AEU37014.1 sugar transporter [Granulicella mallensis MP5ACTX8]